MTVVVVVVVVVVLLVLGALSCLVVDLCLSLSCFVVDLSGISSWVSNLALPVMSNTCLVMSLILTNFKEEADELVRCVSRNSKAEVGFGFGFGFGV